MEIRQLGIGDYEEIVALWQKAKLPFKPKGRDKKESIAVRMAANPDFFLGAFEDNHLIGVVILTCDGRKGWLNHLAIDPDYRRRGVANALVAESEKILRKHGMKIFCVLINDWNKVSMTLFKKCGYVEHRDIIYFSKRDSEDI